MTDGPQAEDDTDVSHTSEARRLKCEVNALCARLGEPIRNESQSQDAPAAGPQEHMMNGGAAILSDGDRESWQRRLDEQTAAARLANEQWQAEVEHRRRVEEELRQSLKQAEESRRAMLGTLEDVVHAERQASLRARQHAAIAELGQLALTGADLSAVLDQAVSRLAQVLEVELCKVLELQAGGSALLLRAGVGWHEGLVGRATVGTGPDSQSGFTLQSREPVIVEDLRIERRFFGPPLLPEHGVISGASVIIGDPQRPYGVLGVHSTRRRDFSGQDIHFLQGVANVLAETVQRRQHQAEIERLNRLYATVSQVNQAIVRCRSREEIGRDVCRAVVEFGRFTAAWIGWRESDGPELMTLAHCASSDHRGLAMPGWRGPCGIAAETLRTGRATLCQDASTDPRAAVCQELLGELGVRSCAAFPLRMRGQLCGVFTICSIEPGFFCGEEIRLLDEVAADISFALDKLNEEDQRRQAEESLRQRGEELTTVLDILPAIVWVALDPECRVITGNLAANQLTGTTPGTNVSQTAVASGQAVYLRQLKPDGNEYRVEELPMQRAIALGQPVRDAEIRFCFLDGRQVDTYGHAAPLFDAQGHVRGAVAAMLDVTARKQADEALLRQTRVTAAINQVLLKTLACDTDAEVARTCLGVAIDLTGSEFGWIGEIDSTGRLNTIALSAQGEQLAALGGAPEGMLKGLEICGIFGRVFRDGQSLMASQPVSNLDDVGIPASHPVVSAFLGVPLEDSGRTIGMIALANKCGGYEPHDQAAIETLSVALVAVMKRKRAEAERRRLMIAIEQAGEAIVVTDPQGTIEYVNPAFETVTGYSRLVAVGQNPRILKSGKQDDAFYRHLWETISGGRTWQGRMINRRRDGSLYTEEATISPVRNAAGRVVSYVAIKRDISEQLRDAEDKARLAEQLRQAQRVEAVGRLAGGVAHDFNNMLGVILGYGQIILNELNPQDPLCESVKEIISAGERSANLTRQLLAFSRRQTLRPVALDLNAVIRDVQGLLRRLIGEDVRIDLQLAEGLAAVMADPGQIEQVIMNLAVNARDAMPRGGTLTVETAPVEWPAGPSPAAEGPAPGTYVMLALTDTGTGMDRETMAHIFEPFFTTKEAGKGTGLGLATVYGIVKQSGGGILVDSEPGQGTRFRIFLPTATRPAETCESQAGQPGTLRGRESILVVEDEPALRELVENVLRGLGYRVYAATNGEEAARLVEQFGLEPELLLTDVVMPGMSGPQLIERLRRTRPGLRVLYMSGYTDDTLSQHLALDSNVPFIQKPFSAPALSEKVREALCGGPG